MELTMYYNPRLRRQGPLEYDWTQDQFGSLPLTGQVPARPPQQQPDQPNFGAYPDWAHGVMAQVYPRLDQAGRLSEPLVLDDSAEIGEATEVYKRIHPLCSKPNPSTPECDAEWDRAQSICALLAFGGAFTKGRGRARGHAGRSIEECICGRVSQGCGGNPFEKDPYAPKPKPKSY
jgi:hypothetical protein